MEHLGRSWLHEALRVTEEQRVLLEEAATLSADECLILMAELGRRQAELRSLLNTLAAAVGLPSGARARILRYFVLTQGKIVDKDELAGVAGIHEWARRVRELRVEEGWPIAGNEERPDLEPGQYVLEDGAPDPELRRRWETAHRIRTMSGAPSVRVLAFLQANVGKRVSQDELYYVAKVHEYSRCIRELREAGWSIKTAATYEDLREGEYMLKDGGVPYETEDPSRVVNDTA